MSQSDTLCAECGAEVLQARGGLWVHIEDIPPGHEPHGVDGTTERGEWNRASDERRNVHILAAELLHHHLAIHPGSDCPFAARLAEALRTK